MPVRLSNKDLAALTRASTILVNPFSYEDEAAWQRAACSAVQALVDADASSTAVPVGGKTQLGGEPEIVRVLELIFPPPEWVSDALVVQRDLRMNVADWSDVFDVSRVRRSAFYNDVVRPRRLLSPIHVMEDVALGHLPASITVYYENELAASAHVSERKEKLKLLLPAFRAGIRVYTSLAHNRAAALVLAETTQSGVLLCDTHGHVLYANSSFERLLLVDPERERVRREIVSVATGVARLMTRPASTSIGPIRASSKVRTATAQYKVSAVFMEESWTGRGATVVVLVDPTGTRGLDATELARHFGLTPREIEVAQLVRRGLSTKQIAELLNLSVNTARRHVERILAKLDVHSRSAAVSKLAGA
jgi:DNA-binding CsgD family transcriptional regulator/PAS domain-containing protein